MLRSGVSVSLSGRRALRLVSTTAITIDGGMFNATAPTTSISASAQRGSDCGYEKWGQSTQCFKAGDNVYTQATRCSGKSYESFHKGKLGGFDGQRASGYSSYTSIQAVMSASQPPLAEPHGRTGVLGASDAVGAEAVAATYGQLREDTHSFGLVGAGGSFGGKGSVDANADDSVD